MSRHFSFSIVASPWLIATCLGTMIATYFPTAETVMAGELQIETPLDTGIHDLTINTEVGNLRYSLHVPESLPRDGSQPLILVLHYGGTPSGFYGRPLIEQLVLPAFGSLNPVIVAPVRLAGVWKTPDKTRLVFELLAALERSYSTDPNSRVITGYSMGAMGTWHMVSEYQNYFTAAIAISGFTAIEPQRCTTPLYALHSRADSIFDAERLQTEIDKLDGAGCKVRVDFIDGIDHYNIPAFAPMLKNTLPWLLDVWGRTQ
ncbi:MAG: putative peptidase [Gammaproteobacteria bacterium]|jgi:predicted peptidase